jgi:phosphoserine phosphatase
MPQVAGDELAGWSRPADSTGGDVYDVVADAGRIVLLLGDATGHGIGPALSVTQVRSMLRMALRLGGGLDAIFGNLNDQLSDDLPINRFVTAFLGTIDTASHTLVYQSAGQGPILHVAASGQTRSLETTAAPLGMLPGLRAPAPLSVALEPGDLVALITDGVFERENASGVELGSDAVVETIRSTHALPVAGILERIVEACDGFAGGRPQADDMTLLLLRRQT